MDLVLDGSKPNDDVVSELRILFGRCSVDPNAVETICYHGSKSLLAQLDGHLAEAIKHRTIETQKIRRAYELEQENPTNGWSLQDYSKSDIEKRTALMNQLVTQFN